MKPDTYIEKVIKSVEDATGNFNSGLPAIEKRMLGEILTLLKDLKLKNGNIVSGTENLKIISGIQKKIEKLVISKKYVKDLTEFVRSYNTIAAHHKSFYSQFPDFKPSPYYDMVKTTAMHNTIDALTEVGIKANVLNPMRNLLLTAVTSGQSYASLTDTLRKEMIGEDGKPGSLSRYASTYVVTSISQFSGQYLSAINADMGFKWYGYRGSNLTTTREFCEHMVKKGYIHESEFATVLSGNIDGHQCRIYEKTPENKGTGLPYGLMAGTTPENFVVNRGGWNCNHSLYPLPDAAVPKELREKLETQNKKAKLEKTEEQKADIQKRWDERAKIIKEHGAGYYQNLLDTERKLGIVRGQEMDFLTANELRGNVNYSKGGGYYVNCQSCVVANELRRRGFDVTAQENTKKQGNIPYELSSKTEDAWRDANGNVPAKQKAGGRFYDTNQHKTRSKTVKELYSEFDNLTKDEGRYHIDWRNRGYRWGHIITAERLQNGDLRFYDPQNGKATDWAKLSKEISLPVGLHILRVDNLLVNTSIVDGIVVKR